MHSLYDHAIAATLTTPLLEPIQAWVGKAPAGLLQVDLHNTCLSLLQLQATRQMM